MGALVDALLSRDGAPRFAPEVFADALAWLILGAGDALAAHVGSADLPDEAARHLGALARRAGITDEMDAGAMQAAIAGYFAEHPLPVEVRTAVEHALRSAALDGAGAVGNEVGQLIGSEAARGVLERKAPPPPGTVAAGPMARFQIGKERK